MNDATVSISFAGSGHVAVELPRGAHLSECLTLRNSPLLFGCRTGICGTCAVRVEVLSGEIPAPAEDERLVLSLVAPGLQGMRLACQLTASGDLRIERLAP